MNSVNRNILYCYACIYNDFYIQLICILMFKIIFNFCGVGLLLAGLGVSQAMAASVSNDQLSQLIQRVELSKKTSGTEAAKQTTRTPEQTEKNLLGRASWNIQCRVNVFEDSKVCIMKKNHIIVMRLNNDYSVSIGDNHQTNTLADARVDSQDVIQAREGLYRNADNLIDQMKKGSYLFTRYKRNGDKDYTEAKTSLVGFTAAFQDLQTQFTQATPKL